MTHFSRREISTGDELSDEVVGPARLVRFPRYAPDLASLDVQGRLDVEVVEGPEDARKLVQTVGLVRLDAGLAGPGRSSVPESDTHAGEVEAHDGEVVRPGRFEALHDRATDAGDQCRDGHDDADADRHAQDREPRTELVGPHRVDRDRDAFFDGPEAIHRSSLITQCIHGVEPRGPGRRVDAGHDSHDQPERDAESDPLEVDRRGQG